jgi:release factor glutamine methyltransferase
VQSVIEILSKCEEFFASKGIPNPKLDAQLLLAKALKCKRLDLFLRFEDPVSKDALDEFREDVRRRAKREPLQHILGTVDFAGLTLKSDARALIPRHETEELCDMIIQKFADRKGDELEILDLGTGSGAIILALKNAFQKSKCTAVDASEDALALAMENAKICGLEIDLISSDWFENVSGKFDIIVSNPPYLTEQEMESAQAEVKNFDPKNALYSPDEGLRDLRKIMEAAPGFLKPNGIIALECGLSQPSILKGENPHLTAEVVDDASRRERFVFFYS